MCYMNILLFVLYEHPLVLLFFVLKIHVGIFSDMKMALYKIINIK